MFHPVRNAPCLYLKSSAGKSSRAHPSFHIQSRISSTVMRPSLFTSCLAGSAIAQKVSYGAPILLKPSSQIPAIRLPQPPRIVHKVFKRHHILAPRRLSQHSQVPSLVVSLKRAAEPRAAGIARPGIDTHCSSVSITPVFNCRKVGFGMTYRKSGIAS